MNLQRYTSAASFLKVAQSFLLAADAENNLILGIAGDLARGHVSSSTAPYFATVHDGSEISVCAFSSVPSKVGITRATNPAALPLLAADVAAGCPEVQSAAGPEPTASAFADQLAAQFGARSRLSMSQRIHELRAVEPLPDLSGGGGCARRT